MHVTDFLFVCLNVILINKTGVIGNVQKYNISKTYNTVKLRAFGCKCTPNIITPVAAFKNSTLGTATFDMNRIKPASTSS